MMDRFPLINSDNQKLLNLKLNYLKTKQNN